MAATTYYVDTDVVGGDGDGTSWANAFADLTTAENGLDKDLDAANEQMTIYCSGDTVDDANVIINGWTTSAADYLTIAAANETDHFDRAVKTGIDTARYTLAGAGNDNPILINEDFVRISGIQINHNTSAYAQLIVNTVGAGSDIRIGHCYIKGVGAHDRCITVADADAGVKVYNCILVSGYQCAYHNGATTYAIYNSILYGGSYGALLNAAAGTFTFYNCANFSHSEGGGDWYDFGSGATYAIDHCASDDGGGTNEVAESGGGAAWPSDFNDASNGDFTLLVNSNLVGAGVDDPGSGLYSDDIDYAARTSTWDVGADEYVAAAGGANYIPAIDHYQRMRVA